MTEDLACHDSSCAPPPVGTGGSSSRPGTGLSPLISGRKIQPEGVDIDHLTEQQVMAGYRVEVGPGISFEPQGARKTAIGEWEIDGDLVDGTDPYDPQFIGHFRRKLSEVDGRIVATHDELFIDDAYQGRGYAQRFNDHSMKFYESIGVDRIELEAGATHGPFAWARQGYRYDDRPDGKQGDRGRHEWVSDRVEQMRAYVRMRHSDGDVTAENAQALDRELVELKNASRAGQDVQPIHIASFGEGDTRVPMGDSWLGKNALVNDVRDSGDEQQRGYMAVYYLEGRQVPGTVASALKNLL